MKQVNSLLLVHLHGLEAVALGQGPLHAGAGGLAEQEPREAHFEPGAGNPNEVRL